MLERLVPYYEAAQQEAQLRAETLPLRELERMIIELPDQRPRFTEALVASDDVAVIAEHKRKSPSEGEIGFGNTVAWTVEQYRKGGAVALSILTQEKHFGGTIDDLTEARQAVDLPILRKDFIKTTYQLCEAKAFGADAALLIVGGLSDTELRYLHEEATDIGLDCLVEVHDEEEMDRALQIEPRLIGINNRNLTTMECDLNTTRELIKKVPDGVTSVAESGYKVKRLEDIAELRSPLHVDGVLMGEALMRTDDPAGDLSNWLSIP